MAAHRYWRLMDMQSAAGSFTQLCEFYLRQSYGGTNEIPAASSALNSFNGSTGPDKSYDGNAATFYMQFFGDGNPNLWVAYDYGSAIDPVEMYLKASTGDIVSRTMTTCLLQYSDTGLGGPWTDFKTTGFATAWTVDGQTQTQDLYALTPSIRANTLNTFAVINFPTEEIDANQLITVPVFAAAPPIRVNQATTFYVARGKIDNPKLIAWYYTLDGHDYYVLKLGTDGKTLVFDLLTQQWSWWSTAESLRWRPSVGMNWVSSDNIAFNYGSNVIAGDDTLGILWVLDPEQGLDDALTSETKNTFPRSATGQMITRDRNFLPVFSVDLTASLGDPALTDNTVTLEYSDDQGHTYTTADGPSIVVAGNYDQEFCWYSLGLVRSPGRLFRISDDGSFARVDGLDVNA